MPLVWILPARPVGGMTAPIGGRAYEAVPLTSEEWNAMKTKFDEKTGERG